MNRRERIEILRRCEESCAAVHDAARAFCRMCQKQPELAVALPLSVSRVERGLADLEQAFHIRLFAEFEATMRDYWKSGCGRKTNPQAAQLITALASRLHAPSQWHNHVHLVRGIRNGIVHDSRPSPISLSAARGHLCRFLSLLPHDW